MGERKRLWVRGVVWLCLGIVCWCLGVSAEAARSGWWDVRRVSYRNDGASIQSAGIDALRRAMAAGEHGGKVSGWAEQHGRQVSNVRTQGSASVDILWTDGDAALVWDLPVIDGYLPTEGDNVGCAIDEGTALSLFGTAQAAGQTVRIEGETLPVRGVFALPKGLGIAGADPGRGLAIAPLAVAPEGTGMTALSFVVMSGDGTPPTEQISSWLVEAGLPSGTLDDHADVRALHALLADVPAYLLGLLLLLELWTALRTLIRHGRTGVAMLREDRLTPRGRYARLAVRVALGAIGLLGLGALVVSLLPPLRSVPPSYLPTSWADFGFYSDLVMDALQASAERALSGGLRMDQVYRVLGNATAVLLLASALCLLHGYRQMARAARAGVGPAGCLGVAALCAMGPLALWLAGQLGWPRAAPEGVLWLPALLCVLCCVLRGIPLHDFQGVRAIIARRNTKGVHHA